MMKKRLLRLFSIFLCLILMWSAVPAVPAAELLEDTPPAVQVKIFGGVYSDVANMCSGIASVFKDTIKSYKDRPIQVTTYMGSSNLDKLTDITVENTQLLVILCPDDEIEQTCAEKIREYMSAGGCVWLSGEHQEGFKTQNENIAALSKYLKVSFALGEDSIDSNATLITDTSLGTGNMYGAYETVRLYAANNIITPNPDDPPDASRPTPVPIITCEDKTYMIDASVEKGYLTVSADLNIFYLTTGVTPYAAQILYNLLDRSYTEIQKNRLPHTPPVGRELTYSGEAQTLVEPGRVDADKGTMLYSLNGTDWSEALPAGVDAGTYPVYWKIDAAGGYVSVGPETVEAEIKKADPVYTPPSGQNLTYTGQSQVLGTLGSVSGGTMEYSLDRTAWSTAFPSGLEVNTYTVYWRITGDSNHNDVEGSSVESTITARPESAYRAPVGKNLTYSGEAQTLVEPGWVEAGKGTMLYSLNGTDWSGELPAGVNVGTYSVYWKIDAAEGYDSVGPETVEAEIKKADPVYTPPSGQNLTYTGQSQVLGNLGSVTGGIMEYSLDKVAWSTEFPSGLEAETYTVYWRIKGDSNHNDVEGSFVESAITAEPVPVPQPVPTESRGTSYPVVVLDRTPPGGSVRTNYGHAEEGTTIIITATPMAGHRVLEITAVDKEGNILPIKDMMGNRYSFRMADSRVEVSVSFARTAASGGNGGTSEGAASSLTGFADVSAGAWYRDGIQYCLDKGLMVGDGGVFRPDARISRAAFAAILWRMSGSPAAGGTLSFNDVAETDWYAGAVRWAVAERLINGYDAHRFGAGDPLSREQMVTILWRYAQHEGVDVFVPTGNLLSAYADAGSVSAYARPAMEWACRIGLLNGRSRAGVKVLEPREAGSRAQTAVIVARYARSAEKWSAA